MALMYLMPSVEFGMALCNDRRWPETYRVMALKG